MNSKSNNNNNLKNLVLEFKDLLIEMYNPGKYEPPYAYVKDIKSEIDKIIPIKRGTQSLFQLIKFIDRYIEPKYIKQEYLIYQNIKIKNLAKLLKDIIKLLIEKYKADINDYIQIRNGPALPLIFFMKLTNTFTEFNEIVLLLIDKNVSINFDIKYFLKERTLINYTLYLLNNLNTKNNSKNYNNYYNENYYTDKAKIFTNYIKLFIDHGIDINYYDDEHESSLIVASRYGNSDIVNILLGVNLIDINVINKDKNTALMIASECASNIEIVDILLENGIDVNMVNKDKNTALMYCLSHINQSTNISNNNFELYKEILKLLIDNGTNLKLINNSGDTALSLAKKNTKLNDIALLIKDKLSKNLNKILNTYNNSNKVTENVSIKINDLVLIPNGEYMGYIFKIIKKSENNKYVLQYLFHNVNIISAENIQINSENMNFFNISKKNNLTNSIAYIIDGEYKGHLIKINNFENNFYNISFIKIKNKIIKNIKFLNNISISKVIY